MKNNLSELMEHITYFYQNIPSSYDSDIEFEVYLKDKEWKITNFIAGSQEIFTKSEDALQYMIDFNVDLLILHNLVHHSVCTEGTLRRMQLKKVEELVGVEEIDKQAEGWENFAKSIAKILNPKEEKPSTLSLVD